MKKSLTLLALAMLCVIFSCNKESPNSILKTDNLNVEVDFSKGLSAHIPDEFRELYSTADLEEIDQLAKRNFDYGIELRSNKTHYIKAGSQNGLAAALAVAGRGDKIVFRQGIHYQDGTTTISKRVKIMGEKGATVKCSGLPLSTTLPAAPTAAFQIQNANFTTIENIQFSTTDDSHPLGIFILNSKYVRILNNKFDNFQFGVIIQDGPHARIFFNRFEMNPSWQVGSIPSAQGVMILNGDNIIVAGNYMTNCVFGLFTGGKGGVSWGNRTEGNLYGQIFCRVPPSIIINGDIVGARRSTSRWYATENRAFNNFNAGLLVIDGANHCLLSSNYTGDNGMYGIELAGVSQRFGFETPACYNNRVHARNDQIVKDCGDNNYVLGGVKVNIKEDQCN